MIEQFLGFCFRIPRTILLALLMVLIWGGIAYVTIPKESSPDIPLPFVNVHIHLEGISPEDAERLLIRPMENELRSIEGIKNLTATAVESAANIVVEFEAGFDAKEALDSVREKVDLAKAELPEDADEPVVEEINFALFPVIVVALAGDLPERALVDIARDLRDELEGLGEVLEVTIGGDREEQVDVIVDPTVYESYGFSQEDIFSLASRNNQLIAAGTMDSGAGRMPVKVPGLFEDVEDIIELPIKVTGDRVIRLSEVATVRDTFKDRTEYARLNGLPAVTLEIKKRVGENVIATIDKVRDVVAREQPKWPEGVQVSYTADQSKDIRTMLTDLQNNMLSAVALVMIVIVGALGIRTGLLVGVAIPGSFLAGMLVLSLMGLTVNIVVLFSLILAVGMLVDGAIVVTELADRKMNEGLPRSEAYPLAARRMAMPIIASTVTTLAAYMPLLFWPGMVGEFMKYLPITLIATLSASLFMALIFVPTLGRIFGAPGPASKEAMKSLAAAEQGHLDDLRGFTGWYVRRLALAARRPVVVLLLSIGTLFGAIILYGFLGRGVEFFPSVEPERANLFVRIRGNLSVDEMDALVREVEREVLATPGIRTTYTRSGILHGLQNATEDTHGVLQLEFIDWQERDKASEILDDIRKRTSGFAGIVVEQRIEEGGPPTGQDVQVEFSTSRGDRYDELIPPLVEKTVAHMREMEGLKDVNDSRPVPAVEWRVMVDRVEAARFGADVALLGNAVQFVTNGLLLGDYRPAGADDEVDIRVRYPDSDRHLGEIANLRVNTPAGLIPAANFIDWKGAPKVGQIERINSRRVLRVTADVDEDAGFNTAAKVQELRAWLENEAGLDPAIDFQFKGQQEEQEEAQAFLMNAFVLALAAMFIILVTQFNSFYNALLILTAVVFSTIGVFLGLLITHQPFGIVMNGIGVISLAGIVVNNNIVLIDTFKHLKENGMDPFEAVLRTGAQRLRPVLLTTVTTVLGLLPMVFSLNIDFFKPAITHGAPSTQWWTQLATSVAFGLIFATFLTLVLTPALLAFGNRLENAGLRFSAHTTKRAVKTTAAAEPGRPPLLEPGN